MKKQQIIGWYEIIGGIIGVGTIVLLLLPIIGEVSNQPNGFLSVAFFGIALAMYSYIVYAGIALLKDFKKGKKHSIIAQAMQVPFFIIAGIGYKLTTGISIILNLIVVEEGFNLTTNFWLGANFNMFYNPQASNILGIGINIFPLIVIYFLRKKNKE